jgi:ADP-ribosyl-[dinitrogen reductase] hydrolase
MSVTIEPSLILSPSVMDRALGAFFGVAIGDALGATVEFMTAREIACEYKVHNQIIGGGWLNIKPGRVTDDTEMSLALGEARARRSVDRKQRLGC